jgi:alkaline phosphatase
MRFLHRIKRVSFFLFAVVFTACGEAFPKYIFLFIGDGMGGPHVLATEQYLKDTQIRKGIPAEQVTGLVMTSLPVKGWVSTDNISGGVTDSAASATAFSTGQKVANGELNVDASTGRTLEPMAAFAKRHGYKVGIISSAAPNHATPAGFYATAGKRSAYPEIAFQMVRSELDYIGGPFLIRAGKSEEALVETAVTNGFTVVNNRLKFDALKPGSGKVWVHSPMTYLIDEPHSITLADHTRKAIEMLKDSPGFFMMVEGAAIDWAGHANDGAAMVYETIAFDEAIRPALDFYRLNPDETLILVTSDHETGGLSLDMEKLTLPGMSAVIQAQKGSRNRSGTVFKKIEEEKLVFEEALPWMKEFFGAETLTDQETATLRAAFTDGGEAKGDFSYGDNKKIALAWVRLVSARAGMIWSSLSHTGDLVPLYAVGAQSGRFASDSDNALIGRLIRSLIAGE